MKKTLAHKHKIILIIFAFFVAIIFLSGQVIPITQAQRLNEQCKDFGTNIVNTNKDIFENENNTFFYSKRLDTCIKQEIDELGIEYKLCDIKFNYHKKEFFSDDSRLCGAIFYCDRDGVDNVVLEKADKLGGYLFDKPYTEYLDNGEGGEPRATKKPDEPYTRKKCEEMFDKKLSEIK